MTVRAVFWVSDVHYHHGGGEGGQQSAEVTLAAAFGSYLKGLPGGDEANKDWSKYTPTGKLTMTITNPDAIAQLELGAVYSLTLEKLKD